MRKLLLSAIFLCSCQQYTIEKVVLYPADNCKLEFTAIKRDVAQAEYAPGVCIYEDELYLYALRNPPHTCLKSGTLYIDAQAIDLNVRNLATPWVEKSDLSKADVELKKMMLENIPYYDLKVRFCKGGANDYMVEWIIYKDKSVRTAIQNVRE